jgi:hypothetical protein
MLRHPVMDRSKARTKRTEEFAEAKPRVPERISIREYRSSELTKKSDSHFSRRL